MNDVITVAIAATDDETRVAALVDRFTESCYTLDIDADSWRQKKK